MAEPVPTDDAPLLPTAVSSPIAKTDSTHRTWLLALVLVIATFVAYLPAMRAGFIWDDDDHLTANPAMTAPHGLRMIWSSLTVSRYYPLTLTTFWLQRRLWGLNPLPYHVVNITLHALNGILFFLVLRRLRVRAAWLAAMLWALHPVNVESAAWITELKNTQSGVFFFLAVLCFLRFDAQERRGWYVLTLLCALAAMLSKPSTTVLPLVLLLCVWWNRGRWQRTDIARIIPLVGLALAMSALTVIEQRRAVLAAHTGEWHLGRATRLIIAGKTIWFYAAKVLWPVHLMFVYPRWAVDATSLSSWMPLAGLVGVGLILWRYRRRPGPRAALFGCGCFVVALLPVLGFLDVYYFRFSFVADHFQYLASASLVALAAGAGTALCDRATARGKHVGAAVATVILFVLGSLTWRQAHCYRDAQTLWQDTIAKNPQCWLGQYNLGLALLRQGRLQEATEHWEQALQIKPDLAQAHYNLGNALLQDGKIQEAIAHYEQALRADPDLAEAHHNLGIALEQADRVQEAVGHYQQALRINPDYAKAHNSLGNALLRAGKLQEAIGQYEQALRIDPGLADAHYNLGIALEQAGQAENAIQHYEQALRINPDFAQAQIALARARTAR